MLSLTLFLILIGPKLPPGVRSLLMEIMIFSIYAMAFDILFGFSNQFSFGQALFFGVGAYGVLLPVLRMGSDLWTAMVISLMLCLFLAISLGYLAVRLSQAYFVIITIIFNLIFFLLALDWTWLTGGDDGLTFTLPPLRLGFVSYSLYDPMVNYYFILSFLIFAYLLLRRIIGSPLGRILICIRENEGRARFLGYNVTRYKLIAYIISALAAGLSGALFAIRSRYASADYFSLVLSGEPVVWTLLGGAGTLVGPILGAAILTPFAYYVSAWWKHYLILVGVLLIVVLRVAPRGIVGYLAGKMGVRF